MHFDCFIRFLLLAYSILLLLGQVFSWRDGWGKCSVSFSYHFIVYFSEKLAFFGRLKGSSVAMSVRLFLTVFSKNSLSGIE